MGRDQLRLGVACCAVTIACAAACGSSDSVPADGSAEDGSAIAEGGESDGAVVDGGGSDGTLGDAAGTNGGQMDGPGASADASTDGASDAPTDSASADASDGGDGGSKPFVWLPGNVRIRGLSSDNYVLYFDANAASTYLVQPLAGGIPTSVFIIPAGVNANVFTTGKVFFVRSWAGANSVGPLTTWSSSMAQPATVSAAGLAYDGQTMWATDDGQFIAYLQSNSQKNADLYGANVDGTGARLLAANVNITDACFPRLTFEGGYAVVSYCAVGDAGLSPIVQSFAPGNGWAPAVVATNYIDQHRNDGASSDARTYPFAVDQAGQQVVAASSTSGNASLQVFSIDGGPGAVIDPGWQLTPALSFAASPGPPWSVYYNTDAGALRQTPVANPAPRTLVDGGVNHFDAFSSDGKWILTSTAQNPAGYFADISLVSTVAPGSARLLAASAQSSGLPVSVPDTFDGFTNDASYAIFCTDMIQDSAGAWIQHVNVASVAGSASAQIVSTGYAIDAQAMRGSKILLVDNFQDTDGGSATKADIHVADPSTGAPPTLVASGITNAGGSGYGVTSDGSTILYSVIDGPAPGIYEYKVP